VGGHTLKNLFFCSGHGKTHKDAASVRATHPIPAACGLYYFEVKIVSKGRDGYMGIGLSAQGVNMNRLPGNNIHTHSVFSNVKIKLSQIVGLKDGGQMGGAVSFSTDNATIVSRIIENSKFILQNLVLCWS